MLAGALGLDTTGTIPDLKNPIKAHLDPYKDKLMQAPWFKGLFQGRRQHTSNGEICDGLGEHSSGVGLSRLT